MASSSVFGAIVVPRSVPDPVGYWDADARTIRGGSRNGWFERKCSQLLDVAPNYDALRFFSMQAATREKRERGGLTQWTVLDEQSLSSTLDQLETLLIFVSENIELIFEHLEFGDQGWALDQIRAALAEALGAHDFAERVTDGGEDDTPQFMFRWFVALRNFLRYAKANGLNVVYVSGYPVTPWW